MDKPAYPYTGPEIVNGYRFRTIHQADNAEVASLIRTIMTEYQCVGQGYSIEDAEVDEMFETFDTDRSVFFVIAHPASGRIMGCGGIGPLQGGQTDTCELKKMYFYPEIRGLGLGSYMVEKCLEAAKMMGYERCYLETVERMDRANQLYRKMGFTRRSSPLGNTGHSLCEIYYERRI